MSNQNRHHDSHGEDADGAPCPQASGQARDLAPLAPGSSFFYYPATDYVFRLRDVFRAAVDGLLSDAEREKLHELADKNRAVHETLSALLLEYEEEMIAETRPDPAPDVGRTGPGADDEMRDERQTSRRPAEPRRCNPEPGRVRRDAASQGHDRAADDDASGAEDAAEDDFQTMDTRLA
jgi:hypothetical protein